jgi:hypothetical protein
MKEESRCEDAALASIKALAQYSPGGNSGCIKMASVCSLVFCRFLRFKDKPIDRLLSTYFCVTGCYYKTRLHFLPSDFFFLNVLRL